MKLNYLSLILSAALLSGTGKAQEWASKMFEPGANFYEVQRQFNEYWSTRDNTVKGSGYKAFKRWENFVERRVYPSGDLSQLTLTSKNYAEFYENYKASSTSGKVIGGGNLIASATWTPIGPMGAISGTGGGQQLKSGRVGFITLDPTNVNNLWIGTPAGGLWKSTNGGTSWTTNTDLLTVIGCSDLAIDPTNTNVMYLATGDGDGGDTPSIGVLKSTDGGVTWSATGLTAALSQYFLIRRLIINPSNTQILLAATNSGIYRTTNGGANWTQVNTNSCYDLEFMPGNPNIVYAGGTSFRLSTNGGSSFALISTGIPTSGVSRMAVAVTKADSSYVYVLAANSSNTFNGLYRSTNFGSTFSVMSTTPNILGYSTTGSDNSGQGWYDLCIAASPLDKNEVVIGGVNVWRSLNGGSNWTLYGHWLGQVASFTHADQHDLEYSASGTLYNTNDGTVYKRTGTTWTEISGSINISQIYRIGMSSLTANKWITGHQDNGTAMWNGTTYYGAMGGDGMDCFFDRTNNNNVFAEYYNGALSKSTNGGTNWAGCTTGLTGSAAWVTPWKQDPQSASVLYCGYTQLFKSTNLAGSWAMVTGTMSGGTITEFAIAPSNNQVIYVLKSNSIWKTTNGGASWTNVTGTVPVASGAPQYVCIDPSDPNNAWVVLSGYSSGNKVFVTTNGGTSWTNYSANLPNIPANCCLYQPGSNDRIYIGMDVGIYYRDNTSSVWTLYNTGLPNVPISELEISPASPTLLHAATFGRGVWVASAIANAVTTPVSSYTVASGIKCTNSVVSFTDQSNGSPTSWSWSVSPPSGVIVSSFSSQNPVMVFQAPGVYTVGVQATNSLGAGTIYNQQVTVALTPTVTVNPVTQTVCGGTQVNLTASGASNYAWSHSGGNAAAASFTPLSSTMYTVTSSNSGCTGSATVMITVKPSPAVTVTGPTQVCVGSAVTLTAAGATSYLWSNSSVSPVITDTPLSSGEYTVTGTINGCQNSVTHSVTVNSLPIVFITASDSIICMGDDVILYAHGALSYTWQPLSMMADSLVLTPGFTTLYSINGIDANGCENQAAFLLNVSECTGIAAAGSLSSGKLTVFPNPAKGKLNISTGLQEPASVKIQLIDHLGRIVLKQELHTSSNDDNAELNISGLSAGQYLLKYSVNDSSPEAIRIIKE